MATKRTSGNVEARLDGLMGRARLPEDLVRDSMQELEQSLAAELSEKRTRESAAAALRKTIYAPIIASAQDDHEAVRAVRDFRQLAPKKSRVKPPMLVSIDPEIFTGPLGARLVPPFPYTWQWSGIEGDARGGAQATGTNGIIGLWTDADRSDSGSASVRGALGIYFYPPTQGGVLQFWSTPAIAWWWSDYAVLDTAHTDAFMGLYVGSYDLNGAFSGAVVDQRQSLWNDTSHFTQTDDHGTNSATTLSTRLWVDNAHQYILWLWCGTAASGPGNGGLFSGGGAWSSLSVTIPSLSWSYE
jgi:hypothetical protein